MEQIKVRKIGNSIGIILPKETGLHAGDLLGYRQEGGKLILDTESAGKEHDRNLIEESFDDFYEKNIYSEEEMKKKFGKYGWGSDV